MESINYASLPIQYNSKVFKYLMNNGYDYKVEDLLFRKLDQFVGDNALVKSFEILERDGYIIYRSDNKRFISRFNKIYSDAINSKPCIQTFSNIFAVVAEEEWNQYGLT